MRLSSQERKKLQEALIDAFPTLADLEQMLSFGLEKNLRAIAGEGSLQNIVFNLIQAADSQGWVEDLIRAACDFNPGNQLLQAIAETLLSNQQPETPSNISQKQSNQEILLERVKKEVENRLKDSLLKKVLIPLEKVLEPGRVKRYRDREVKIGIQENKPIPDRTEIITVFDDNEGKLLILGKPGAGKTTTQLVLAKALIERAERQLNHPIPILLNLSSWKDADQLIIDWLTAEVYSKYRIPTAVSKKWLENQQLLPLLDGLDEVKPQLQKDCIKAINKFSHHYTPKHLVVCCRSDEYDNLSTKLHLEIAICLEPLTNDQIRDYLNKLKDTEIQQKIDTDSILLDLVRTPFILNITILAFGEISTEVWQELSTTDTRINYLLDCFVRRMFKSVSSEDKLYSDEKTELWLVWLGQRLEIKSKTEFLIEELQPDCLEKFIQKLLFRLLTGLIYGIVVGFIAGLGGGLNFGLVCGIVGALVGIITITISNHIEIMETLTWSWEKAKKSMTFALIAGQLFGLVFGVISKRLNDGFILGLMIGLVASLIAGFNGGLLTNQVVETKIYANQGIYKSFSNSMVLGLISGFICALVSELINRLTMGEGDKLIDRVTLGIAGGLLGKSSSALFGGLIGLLASGIAGGGGGCIEHLALRLILYFNRFIPWNYAEYLDYCCTDLLFLQRIGGRYRFINNMLQEYFAKRRSPSTKSVAPPR
ncbi:hypothetical protein NIES4073_35150 [Kalymmatonema gypsitolerans NIES-4073]|nr:hypothetical protein NIES4073_35150 [Scytonema sp. NIES-4073]